MTAILVSCASQSGPPDDLGDRLFPPASPSDSQVAKNLDIYVDGSESMRGYVASAQSVYCNVVRQTVEFATLGQFDLNIYKFASQVASINHLPIGQLQSPQFYDGADTPLATILQRISSSPSHAAIIITDLVQSQKGTDTLVLAQTLANLSHQTREIRLLAYRSSFEGKYYPEKSPGHAFKLAASQSLPGHGRPFYLLVVAPNAESMKRLADYLLSRVPPIEMIDPTGPAVSVESIALAPHNGNDSSWRLYKTVVKRDGPIVCRLASAFRLVRPSGAQEVLPLDFKVRTNIPIRNPAQLIWEVAKVTWKNTGRPDQPVQVTLPVTGKYGKNQDEMKMQLALREPATGTWDIYFIKMHAGQGNLDVPAWVNAWTTDDDSTASNGNRTFQLGLIVQSMINTISERSVFCEYLLEVGR